MTFLPQVELGESFGPFRALRQNLGFLPNLFRAQSLLPRAVEAEAQIADVVLIKPGALTRLQKESILLVLAARLRNTYCTTAHFHMMGALGLAEHQIGKLARDHRAAGLPLTETALLDFSLKLGLHPTSVGWDDIEGLRGLTLTDEQILETVQMTALTQFLCTLAVGLGPSPDFEPRVPRPEGAWGFERHAPHSSAPRPGPYLRWVDLKPGDFPPFAFFLESFGFIPNIFRAQTLRPDVLEAEARAVRDILLTEDVLTRKQKEYILLAISAANLNTYCVAVHCEMLRGLGVPEEQSDQIAVDHRHSELSEPDKALLDFALKLACRASEYGLADVTSLRALGFSEPQILEGIVMTALTNFLNTLQMGLGTVPDFPPRRVFARETAATVNPFPSPSRLKGEPERRRLGQETAEDPDAELVARVRGGDVEAFEELMKRHERAVYRTLAGLTANQQDAEDGAQRVFLRAYERLGTFEGTSRFSTWLTRIAIHEGIERLRRRKEHESLDVLERASPQESERFRPRLVHVWESPEELYARREIRDLVEKELGKLPLLYRTAVILRDIEQLSTAEAAEALGLPVPTLKTRLARGRLMLREALAVYFRPRPRMSPRV